MGKKTMTIDIPEGYVIDKENSDFENGNIVFKEENPLPKTWAEFDEINARKTRNRPYNNIYIEEFFGEHKWMRITNAHTVLVDKHILFLRLNMLCEHYNGYWIPKNDGQNQYVVSFTKDWNGLTILMSRKSHGVFTFKSYELAEAFINNFHSEIMYIKPLLYNNIIDESVLD